jgi:hypothetical protein
VKNNLTLIISICAICISSYAAIAVPINGISENRPLLDAIYDQQAHSIIQVVRYDRAGNLASLWHRLYITDPNFSKALAVSNQDKRSDKAARLNCQTFFCLDNH